jgi:hypothetical protein
MDPPIPSRGSAQNFGINETNLEMRRKFIRLGEEERVVLTRLVFWARSIAPQIAREFYDWQFQFSPPQRFFADYARAAGLSLSQLRQALERTQTTYFTSPLRPEIPPREPTTPKWLRSS